VQNQTDLIFDDQLKLVGYSLGSRTAKTGEILPVNLFWQGLLAPLPDFTMFVQLQDDQGQAAALTERPPSYATSAWQEGTLLRDLHRLRVPATMPPGTYKLAAGILRADKTRLQVNGQDQVLLGEVMIEARPHSFEPPQPQFATAIDFGGAALIGYDLAPTATIQPGQAVDLTLYWRGQNGFDRNWTVFAHIVDEDGRIWGQRDQLPGAGQFPTMSWIPDEIIIDGRAISLPSEMPSGTYFVKIGLYDAHASNFERLPVNGSDAVLLETPLTIPER
jgi:hypothetical protein